MKNLPGKTAYLQRQQSGDLPVEWFVVQTHGFSEKLVVSELQVRDFPAYAPLRLRRRREHGSDVVTAEPLFPRYVFVGMTPRVASWAGVLSLRGVRSVLMNGSAPAVISEKALRAIRAFERQALSSLAPEELSECPFEAGDAVDVLLGDVPVRALFHEKVDSKRVAVLIKGLFGRESRAVVSLSAVTPT